MKFSDYFFVYHVRDPNEKLKKNTCRFIFIIIIINIFLIAGMATISTLVIKIKNVILSLLFTYSVPIVFCLVIIAIKICLGYRIKRIDCFYSSDFNKIFIGTTTINEKCYKNTFEFQLDDI